MEDSENDTSTEEVALEEKGRSIIFDLEIPERLSGSQSGDEQVPNESFRLEHRLLR